MRLMLRAAILFMTKPHPSYIVNTMSHSTRVAALETDTLKRQRIPRGALPLQHHTTALTPDTRAAHLEEE
jgi:hypothetical protein